MRKAENGARRFATLFARIGVAIGALLLLGALLAAPASAAFEQVATFGESGEGKQLAETPGMAVNVTGAGGVPAGTVYAVSIGESIVRYNAKGEFREAWNGLPGQPGFERCGLDGEPSHPTCTPQNGTVPNRGIAVDQATGNVYLLTTNTHNTVHVFNADGSQLIATFGERGGFTEPIEESPEKFHNLWTSGIAVDDTGAVYISDFSLGVGRVMVWKPQTPGDYEHYVYSGRANDIATRSGGHLALDDANNLYSGSSEVIEEFTPAEPDTPACEYGVADEGALALTVNPVSGDVFYFDFKSKKIFQLSACNGQGEFEEKGVLTPLPKTGEIQTLAFNPALAWEASRPSGILYASGVGVASRAYVFAPAVIHLPAVEAEWASAVTATTTTLNAKVNPNGSITHYAFQYISKAAYEENEPGERFAGAIEAPLGGNDLPASQEGLSAAAALTGLSPDGEYHYRVIATSHCKPDEEEELCEATGEDKALRTFPLEAPGLPDHRAWELVSPPQKNGGEVFPLEPGVSSGGGCGICKPGGINVQFPAQSSLDGEAVVYEGYPFSSSEGAANFNQYISRRSEGGWQTTILSPALLDGDYNSYKGFNAELTQGVFYQEGPSLTPDAPFEYANFYTQPTASPSSLTPLVSFEPPNRSSGNGTNVFGLQYAGASDDFTHQLFAANDALTGETPFAPEALDGGVGKYNLYESVGGQLRLINVLPGNAETIPGAGFGSTKTNSDLPGAISADGSHVFWSDETGQLYVRIDGAETQLVSESRRTPEDPAGAQPAQFLTASADGSRALFSSSQELTDDADTGPLRQKIELKATAGTYTLSFEGQTTSPLAFDATNDQIQAALEALSSVGSANVTVKEGNIITFAGSLLETEELISADGSALTGTIALHTLARPGADLYEWHDGTLTDLTAGHGQGGFEGITGQSEDLSQIYFVDTAVLTGEEENEYGAKAQAGKDNLYAWREGESTFVATLLPGDEKSETEGTWATSPRRRTAEASPNGRWLAFSSRASLTGYDNVGPVCSHNALLGYFTDSCTEAFLYDSASGKLRCASCNPAGVRPLGSTRLPVHAPGATTYLPQPRYLTDSGRLFFDTQDALSPFDTNRAADGGTISGVPSGAEGAGAEDVYQYEPEGVGLPPCKREAGCISLISAGHEALDSNFLSTDESGKDVFFTTRDQLVLKDRDDLIDLYDAREGGGIASETETSRGECQGEACVPAISAPNDPTPGSSSFEGAGNVNEKKATKKHKHKKHKHAGKAHRNRAHKRAANHNRGGAK